MNIYDYLIFMSVHTNIDHEKYQYMILHIASRSRKELLSLCHNLRLKLYIYAEAIVAGISALICVRNL
jgi:hypothetical protein